MLGYIDRFAFYSGKLEIANEAKGILAQLLLIYYRWSDFTIGNSFRFANQAQAIWPWSSLTKDQQSLTQQEK